MPIYELKPTSEALDDWEASEYKGIVIVRAQDEKSARSKASFGFFSLIEKKGAADDTPTPPWDDDKLVTCKQLYNSEYEEEGPEEILFPKSGEF